MFGRSRRGDAPRPSPLPPAPPVAPVPSAGSGSGTATVIVNALNARTLVVAAILIFGVLGLIILLEHVLSTAILFLIAVVFAEGIKPLVFRVRRHAPLPLAILVVYVALLIVLGIIVALLVNPLVTQAVALSAHIPLYKNEASSLLVQVERTFHVSSTSVTSRLEGAFGIAQDVLLAVGSTVANLVVSFALILVLGFMWLVTSQRLQDFFVDFFPLHHQPLSRSVLNELGFRMGGYIRAVVINMGVIGFLSGMASLMLGLPSPLLLGIFSGLMEAVPIVGPLIGAIPAVLLGLTVQHWLGISVHPWFPLVVAAFYMVIQQIESNTLVPLVMNRVVALPALAVTLALLIGGSLAGIEGAILAIPVASSLQVIVVRVIVPAVHRSQGRPVPPYVPPAGMHITSAATTSSRAPAT